MFVSVLISSMRRGFLHIFCIFLLLLLLLIPGFASSSPIGDASSSDNSGIVLSSFQTDRHVAVARAGGRSLLYSHEPDTVLVKPWTELVVDLDGTIALKHKSERLLWSFSSGSPIYSSYQAPITADSDKENASVPSSGFFLDYWDDWTLYAHEKHNGRLNLSMTAEDFLKITPHVSHDGVILGSKTSTVFVVDGKTGRLVRAYKSPDPLSKSPSGLESSALFNNNDNNNELVKPNSGNAADLLLHITRTDYKLEYFGLNSTKLLWNLTVAYFGAALLCQDFETPLTEATLNSGLENDFDMPLSCQSKIDIRRQKKSELSTMVLPNSSLNPWLPSQSDIDGSSDNQNETKMLPAFVPDHILPQSRIDKLSDAHGNKDGKPILSLPPRTNNVFGIVNEHDVRMPYNDTLSMLFKLMAVGSLVLFVIFLVRFIVCWGGRAAKEQGFWRGQPSNSNRNASPSQRKKTRKSGKNNGSVERKDKHISSESEDGSAFLEDDRKMLLDINKLLKGSTNGRRIGKLFVSNTEIAKGSNGTVVFEGVYEGRSVAVKRLVRSHYDVALKEIQNLIASDRHPNIVRWYGVEHDQDFVYLSLERCTCSLNDLILIYSDTLVNSVYGENQAMKATTEYKIWLDSVKGNLQDLTLWRASGHPSPILLKLMRDMVSGVAHLHELGIIHRDLKPQNVLIVKERYLCAKLSDMGISKQLLEDKSSLGHLVTGCGSSGWQAPEQLLHGRQTRAIDLFSLGCVLYFCMTGGRHPFGHRLERDVNIVKNKMDLFFVEHIPEALDLISRLLNACPELRPNALEVLQHPLFWSSELRLSFLRDTSDRVELENREADSGLLKALESTASMALGGKWDGKMEPEFITNLGHYRRYKFDSVRDLLRLMRNKLNHYRELPKELQELVGPLPEGFNAYFASRFPRLLIEVYKVVCRYCREEECFQKYFKIDVVLNFC